MNMETEIRKPRDFIKDGILAYGVEVGRFVFEQSQRTVYALTECLHAGPSDVYMFYQVPRNVYDRLKFWSLPDRIPASPAPSGLTDGCYGHFLCGESAYGKRTSFTLADADSSLVE